MPQASSALLAGRFVIEREVGRGGVGIVYRAHDQMSGQVVALKVIALPGVDAGEEARFRREGRVLAGLHHPAIVRVVAFGQLDEGQPYIAMEWLEGEDIAQRQRRSPLDLVASLLVAADVCDALAAAHEAGIVHRDVKPSNIFLAGSRPTKNARSSRSSWSTSAWPLRRTRKLTRTGRDPRHPRVHGARAGAAETARSTRGQISAASARPSSRCSPGDRRTSGPRSIARRDPRAPRDDAGAAASPRCSSTRRRTSTS